MRKDIHPDRLLARAIETQLALAEDENKDACYCDLCAEFRGPAVALLQSKELFVLLRNNVLPKHIKRETMAAADLNQVELRNICHNMAKKVDRTSDLFCACAVCWNLVRKPVNRRRRGTRKVIRGPLFSERSLKRMRHRAIMLGTVVWGESNFSARHEFYEDHNTAFTIRAARYGVSPGSVWRDTDE